MAAHHHTAPWPAKYRTFTGPCAVVPQRDTTPHAFLAHAPGTPSQSLTPRASRCVSRVRPTTPRLPLVGLNSMRLPPAGACCPCSSCGSTPSRTTSPPTRSCCATARCSRWVNWWVRVGRESSDRRAAPAWVSGYLVSANSCATARCSRWVGWHPWSMIYAPCSNHYAPCPRAVLARQSLAQAPMVSHAGPTVCRQSSSPLSPRPMPHIPMPNAT